MNTHKDNGKKLSEAVRNNAMREKEEKKYTKNVDQKPSYNFKNPSYKLDSNEKGYNKQKK